MFSFICKVSHFARHMFENVRTHRYKQQLVVETTECDLLLERRLLLSKEEEELQTSLPMLSIIYKVNYHALFIMKNFPEIFSSLLFLICITSNLQLQVLGDLVTLDENEDSGRFTIEGKVYPPELFGADSDWQQDTTVSINSGEFKGFLRDDGTFTIMSVPSGSYVLEIHNPDYFYEPVRVEINPKGKFRARKVNYVQPGQIMQMPYPLKLKALTRFKYFQTREQWKITDFLFSPMVLMMLLPLLLMLILPKMMSDPETKKEMENINFPKMTNEMPEISEMLTSFFTGGSSKDKEKKTVAKQTKKQRN